MRALPYAVVMILIIWGVMWSISENGYFERRALKRDTKRYIKAHPDHSLSEPVVWQCICGHNDTTHSRDFGCKANMCKCLLNPREVRARY